MNLSCINNTRCILLTLNLSNYYMVKVGRYNQLLTCFQQKKAQSGPPMFYTKPISYAIPLLASVGTEKIELLETTTSSVPSFLA